MKQENAIWLMSSAYDKLNQQQLVEKAVTLGVQGIDLCVFRTDSDRADHTATHLAYESFDSDDAAKLIELFNKNELRMSLGAFDNMIGGDESERVKNQNHLLRLIRIAHLLGGDANDVIVGTFVGYNHELGNMEDGFQRNLDEYKRIFAPIVRYAEDLGVTIAYENCPMEGWRSARYTTTYNNLPGVLAARQLMYAMVDSKAHGEIYDPSHDIWQNTDPVAVMQQTDISRLKRIHVKTTRNLQNSARIQWGGMYPMQQVDASLAEKAGVSIPKNDWDRHHYEAMLPGFGGTDHMDWNAFTATLRERGYSGAFEIENEAKNSKDTGVPAAIDQGIKSCVNYLSPLLWPLSEAGYVRPNHQPLVQVTTQRHVPVVQMKDLL
ncbi:sugar phosphate isomerase/epimerase family protein [Sphingobacterium chungjuense]|uniref:sugar phosphate isomerase/epimerase family protein n=1 Tax=Sphingobacterium chungjuense TaxID=2675553 RepID=UPI0019D1DEE0|nr:sugar phosphate isomerase/epimerase [Sphingobacterium chungjuense]